MYLISYTYFVSIGTLVENVFQWMGIVERSGQELVDVLRTAGRVRVRSDCQMYVKYLRRNPLGTA